MDLYFIDAIAPFFRGYKKKRYNWSKVPFENLELPDGTLDARKFQGILTDFETFVDKAAGVGFNAITIDDVAHLTIHPSYPPKLREKIEQYRRYYRRMFEMAEARGMSVFITTDVMFYNDCLEQAVGSGHEGNIEFLRSAFRELFELFPQVRGIITRIGECDGLDVKGEFRSRLIIRTPRQARKYIQDLLPVFEQAGKLLIFRTWTVGAYHIGDLMWNRHTFRKVFKGIDSESLVISLKYGETDFFRFLPVNGHFYRSRHKKIIELQTRREYEGFGEYPSFTGWDYHGYRCSLNGAQNVIGASFWCQTGGWSPFFSRTYIEDSSVWTEINTFVSLRIFRNRLTPEQAIREYCRLHLDEGMSDRLIELLRLSDEVIRELLYIDDIAEQKIFFRRLRIPPLLTVFWDRIIINHSIKKILRCLVSNRRHKIRQGFAALEKIRDMQQLASEIGLPVEGLKFQYDTFRILAEARKYYFGDYTKKITKRLKKLKKKYKKRYKKRKYKVLLDFTRFGVPKTRLRLLLSIMMRKQRGYRLIDHVLIIRILSWLLPLFRPAIRKVIPDFARKQAMGVEALMK
jgi:hypothetical protein